MKRNDKDAVARRFSNLDLHDDNLVSVKVVAPLKNTDSAKIDFEFRDDTTGRKKLLSLSGCANLRWLMDFDVLASNWFAQTEKAISSTDVNKMRKLVLAQVAHWHVRYMPPSPKDKPIRKKLSSIRKFVLFRVNFFGGTIEVLAKKFNLKADGG
jgi:hypothetical protein